jgi:hypothetical protein
MTLRLAPRTLLLALLVVLSTSVAARADVILHFAATSTTLLEDAQLITLILDLPFSDGPYDTLTSEFSTTVSDPDESGAVTVTPVDASGFMLVPHLDGVDVVFAALGTGCSATGSPGFPATVCDPHSTATLSVSSLTSGVLGARLVFLLIGGGSIDYEGTVTLSNSASVPEPASLLLLALGGAGVSARRRRSRSA